MDWTIRPADEADAARVAELNEVVQALHYRMRPDRFKPPNATAFLPTVESWLRSGTTRVFVADSGDALLGYSVGSEHLRTESALKYGACFAELDQVAVVPAMRGSGVGRALCSAVLDWAKNQGVERVELGTWAFNDRAFEVFEGLGFAPTVRRMSMAVND